VLWNQDGSNPFFADPRVRRALVLATDRQHFVDTVLHGLARVAATSYHPDLSWTDPSVKALPADRDEARRLLDEAGWRDTDGDGKRDRDGRPFAFSLLVGASGQQIVDQMAVWLERSWAEIGVEAKLERVEWNDLRQRRDAFQFEAALSNFSTSFSPDQYELYHTSQRGAGANYGGFSDGELDRLLERGRETFEPAERAAIYHAVQRKLRDLQPFGYLLHIASPVLHDKTLRGIRPSPPDFWSTSEGPRLWYRADPASGG
jgi:peptide/nickel transport system substrate-binding protein